MLKIGITGGMGTGKTTVCKIFEHLHIPTYYADERAKHLINTELVGEISKVFGTDVYKDNVLQNKVLAARAFISKVEIEKLNSIVHPAVARDYDIWQKEQTSPYTLKEAALLIESKSYLLLDKLIVVSAPLDICIARVMARNGFSRKEILSRIDKQMPQAEKNKYADYIIKNNGNESLIHQVKKIHAKILGVFNNVQ